MRQISDLAEALMDALLDELNNGKDHAADSDAYRWR